MKNTRSCGMKSDRRWQGLRRRALAWLAMLAMLVNMGLPTAALGAPAEEQPNPEQVVEAAEVVEEAAAEEGDTTSSDSADAEPASQGSADPISLGNSTQCCFPGARCPFRAPLKTVKDEARGSQEGGKAKKAVRQEE